MYFLYAIFLINKKQTQIFSPDVVTSGRINTHVRVSSTFLYDLSNFDQFYFQLGLGAGYLPSFLLSHPPPPRILGHLAHLFNCP